ncbi:hypothetical protein EDD18DRAFT_602792 [Armillaria luteobubalina]|uniref:Mid2 domain-containing protein n=1 Tax=Armillaria luteobubalina TaxID=153913 RepID=A0AA39QIY2_9AGAR|nr:hypothetical protein EDD18DRAFT_602792 [Armillaria luteobubalina]
MSFLSFQLCTVIAFIPLVVSLNISLPNSIAEAPQSMQVSLFWDKDSPIEFVLGAFTADGKAVASATQNVANFTTDRVVNMTFNCTSLDGKGCKVLAWLPLADPRNSFSQSEPFSVISGHLRILGTPVSAPSSPTVTAFLFTTSGPDASSPTTPSPTTSDSTPSVSSTVPRITSTPVPGSTQSTTKAMPIEAVVGAVIGAFVLLSIVSAALFFLLWRRRSRKLQSAPSRAFWRYLDRKAPPISRPIREPLPAYTAQGRTFQKPAVRPPPLRLPD